MNSAAHFTFSRAKFEQMEVEFFITPTSTQKGRATTRDWYEFWRDWRMEWWRSIGLAGDSLQLREHARDELAHLRQDGRRNERYEYASLHFTWVRRARGRCHRTDFDLRSTSSTPASSWNTTTRARRDPAQWGRRGERGSESSTLAGWTARCLLAVLCESYTKTIPAHPRRSCVSPRLAPIKAGVFPLVNKDGMPRSPGSCTRLLARFAKVGFVETDANSPSQALRPHG